MNSQANAWLQINHNCWFVAQSIKSRDTVAFDAAFVELLTIIWPVSQILRRKSHMHYKVMSSIQGKVHCSHSLTFDYSDVYRQDWQLHGTRKYVADVRWRCKFDFVLSNCNGMHGSVPLHQLPYYVHFGKVGKVTAVIFYSFPASFVIYCNGIVENIINIVKSDIR